MLTFSVNQKFLCCPLLSIAGKIPVDIYLPYLIMITNRISFLSGVTSVYLCFSGVIAATLNINMRLFHFSYTRCMADCRKKVIEKVCPTTQSELELEALKVALSSAQSVTDSLSALKASASHIFQDIFPDACRNAAAMPLRVLTGIGGTDYLSPVVNGTLNQLVQAIQNTTTTVAPGGAAAATKNPGGGSESIKSGFAFSVVLALALAKFLM